MSRSRRRPVALGVCLGLLAVALLGISWLLLSDQGEQTSSQEPRNKAQTAASSPQVPTNWEGGYLVFASRAEGLPKSVSQLLQKTPYVLHEERAQRLQVQAPATIWVVPGKKHLCLITQEIQAAVGTTCAPVARMRGRPLATTFITPPALRPTAARRFIIGIAPRGVKGVVAYTKGSRTRIPVGHGVFAHRDMNANPPDRLTVIR